MKKFLVPFVMISLMISFSMASFAQDVQDTSTPVVKELEGAAVSVPVITADSVTMIGDNALPVANIDGKSQNWITSIMLSLMVKFPIAATIIMILGTIWVIICFVIGITGTKQDDIWLAKVLAIPVLGHFLRFLSLQSIFSKKK